MIGVYIEAGFCNRVFKMVFAYIFSKKYSVPFRFEGWEKNSHHTTQVYEWLVKRFMDTPLYHKDKIHYTYRWNEPSEDFMNYLDVATLAPSVLTHPTYLYGFFQNEGYFKDYRTDVLELLKEPEFVTMELDKIRLSMENCYFLHVRLGDYLQLDKHFIDLTHYYNECIRQIAEKDPHATILVFSNQINHVSDVYPQLYTSIHQYGLNFTNVGDMDEILGFYLMIRCFKGGICSNSTYSWWASWLNQNPNKTVFMPSKWINMNVNGVVYPDYATIINV